MSFSALDIFNPYSIVLKPVLPDYSRQPLRVKVPFLDKDENSITIFNQGYLF